MKDAETRGSIPLTDAAQRLRFRYRRALDLVLAGELEGHKREGRWWVAVTSIDRVLREREQSPSAA